MKIIIKRVAIAVILSFALFVLNYNFLKVRMSVCVIFTLAAYLVINKIIDDYGDDSYFDELTDSQIEGLSNSQLDCIMCFYKRKIINTTRRIENPELKAKSKICLKVVDNAIDIIKSKDKDYKSIFIIHSLKLVVNIISMIPIYEKQKDYNRVLEKQLNLIISSIDDFIEKINNGIIDTMVFDLQKEEGIIEQIRYDNRIYNNPSVKV